MYVCESENTCVCKENLGVCESENISEEARPFFFF